MSLGNIRQHLPKLENCLTAYRVLVVALVGLVIGLISSFATIGFVEAVQWLNKVLYVSSQSRVGVPPDLLMAITLLVPTLGGLIVGLILRFGVSTGKPLGPPDTIYAMQLREKLPGPVSGISSTLAAIVSLGCGAPVGQYGPLVYLGSLVGQLAIRLRIGVRDIGGTAISCGVAAAIATAFNAPIAALIFTHEVILRHYSLRTFTAVTVAAACGFFVANVVFKHPPIFLLNFEQSYYAPEFFLFAIEGLACGMLAVVFMKLLRTSEKLAGRLPIPAAIKPALAGFVLGVVVLQIPELQIAGRDMLRMASIPGIFVPEQLAALLIAKVLLTALCLGFGFAGGIIFPALVIGILFGELFAVTVPGLLLTDYSGLAVYAVCGMVAVMSPVIGAPMTALLIILEMTRSYEITIAAMVTVAFSNLVAFHWYGRSLFDRVLARRGIDLSLGRDSAYLKHQRVVDYLTQVLPIAEVNSAIVDLVDQKVAGSLRTVVVVDEDGKYLGLLYADQLSETDKRASVASLELDQVITIDEKTSLWGAMEIMCDFIGEAIPVVNSDTGRYLGAVPESTILATYLDAVRDLRKEEHEV